MDRRGDYNAQEVSHKETLIVQAVLENQIARLDGRIEAMYLELNGKHGLKEKQTISEQQIASVLCVGKWLAGIFGALILGLCFWSTAEVWKVRDVVYRLTIPPPYQQPGHLPKTP